MPRRKTQSDLHPVANVIDDIAEFLSHIPSPTAVSLVKSKSSADWRKFVMDAGMTYILSPSFKMYKTSMLVTSVEVAKMLTQRTLIFLHEYSRTALRCYKGSVTSGVRGFLLEFTQEKFKVNIRYPLPTKELENRFASWYTDEWIHERALKVFSRRNAPVTAFTWQLSTSCRGFILGIVIHVSSILGFLISKSISKGKEPDTSGGTQTAILTNCALALRKAIVVTPKEGSTRVVECNWFVEETDWFRANVWEQVIDVTSDFSKAVASLVLSEAKVEHAAGLTSEIVLASSKNTDSAVLKVNSQVKAKRIVAELVTVNNHSIDFAVSLGQLAIRILCHYQSLNPEDQFEKRLSVDFWEALAHFLDVIRDVIISSSPQSCSKHRDHIGFSRSTWRAKVQAELRKSSLFLEKRYSKSHDTQPVEKAAEYVPNENKVTPTSALEHTLATSQRSSERGTENLPATIPVAPIRFEVGTQTGDDEEDVSEHREEGVRDLGIGACHTCGHFPPSLSVNQIDSAPVSSARPGRPGGSEEKTTSTIEFTKSTDFAKNIERESGAPLQAIGKVVNEKHVKSASHIPGCTDQVSSSAALPVVRDEEAVDGTRDEIAIDALVGIDTAVMPGPGSEDIHLIGPSKTEGDTSNSIIEAQSEPLVEGACGDSSAEGGRVGSEQRDLKDSWPDPGFEDIQPVGPSTTEGAIGDSVIEADPEPVVKGTQSDHSAEGGTVGSEPRDLKSSLILFNGPKRLERPDGVEEAPSPKQARLSECLRSTPLPEINTDIHMEVVSLGLDVAPLAMNGKPPATIRPPVYNSTYMPESSAPKFPVRQITFAKNNTTFTKGPPITRDGARVYAIEGLAADKDFCVEQMFSLWMQRLPFSRDSCPSVQEWFSMRVSWVNPTMERSIGLNVTDIPRYQGFDEYAAVWRVIIARQLYSELHTLSEDISTWDHDTRTPSFLACYDGVTERFENGIYRMEFSYVLRSGEQYMYSVGDILLVQTMCMTYKNYVRSEERPLLMFVEAIDRRGDMKTTFAVELCAIGICGSSLEKQALKRPRTVNAVRVWYRGNVIGPFIAMRSLSKLHNAPNHVLNFLIGLPGVSKLTTASGRGEKGDILDYPSTGTDRNARKIFQKNLSSVVGCVEAASYINACTVSPRTGRLGFWQAGIPQLNLRQGVAVAEALRCCYDENQSEQISRTNDFTFGIVGPAGTGKTGTILHIISALMSSARVSIILKKLEEYRRKVIGDCNEDCLSSFSVMRSTRALVKIKDTREPLGAPESPEKKLSILILSVTHAALNEIELRLQSGIYVSGGINGMERITPQYRRLARQRKGFRKRGRDEQGDSLNNRREELFPDWMLEKYAGSITLTTFGSLRRAFDTASRLDGRTETFDQYDIVIVEEASLAQDSDFFQLFEQLIDPSRKLRRGASILFVGDHMQLSPIVTGFSGGGLEHALGIARLSLFERCIHSFSLDDTETTSIDFVTLNVQYRMHPVIARLGNIVSGRTVQNAGNTLTDHATIFFYDDTRPRMERGHMIQCPLTALQRPVVWFDPYEEAKSTTQQLSPLWRHILPSRAGRYESFEEVRAVAAIIDTLLHNGMKQSDIIVLTPYRNQKTLLLHVLPIILTSPSHSLDPAHLSRDKQEFIIPIVTVASVQGKQAQCVILSPCVHDEIQDGWAKEGFGGLGIVKDVRALYVSITRARFLLYIVGDSGRLARSSPAWKAVVDFCTACKPSI